MRTMIAAHSMQDAGLAALGRHVGRQQRRSWSRGMQALYLLVPLMAWSAWSAPGATIYTVNPEGTGDFPNIQAAVDAAVNGDIIELTDGTFSGPGNRDIDFDGKAITLRSHGDDPLTCIVSCADHGGPAHQGLRFHNGEDTLSVVRGITISDATASAVRCYQSSATIERCIIRGSSCTSGGGGLSCVWGSPQIKDCTFVGNSAGGEQQGGAALCGACSFVVFTNCTFAGNSAAAGSAIYATFTDVRLRNCIIAFGDVGAAVLCAEGGDAYLQCCDLFGNAGGDWVGEIATQLGQNGNISQDPLFCNWIEGNYNMQEDSPCAPFSPPNPECDLIGAWSVGCGEQEVHPGTDATAGLSLLHAYPNPFEDETRILYRVPGSVGQAPVHLDIVDAGGRHIRTLLAAPQTPGFHAAGWDGCGAAGEPLPGGVYFVRVQVTGQQMSRRLVLLQGRR